MNIAVILTTYNRPDALDAVLNAFNAQTDREFEIVVADDGSDYSTALAVEQFKQRTDIKVSHIWHEDKGFRAGAIRNRAVDSTDAEYIIFSDGDCIPLVNFVEAHRRLAETKWFVAGNRILLEKEITESILNNDLPVYKWPKTKWLSLFRQGNINRLIPVLSLPLPSFVRKMPARSWKGVMTCNLAVWRGDFMHVNGFDESYQGWGLEDSDLVIRMIRAGIRHKSARFSAPVFHLWHSVNDRTKMDLNRALLDDLIHSDRILAEDGIKKKVY